MAANAVWGIDIGQCALKALRCSLNDNDQMVADAFDFIEYPKLLSQPEADADELIREALEQFLERNETKGDAIAINVSGQAGLARFFKPPPVDAKVLPDIVKYEARQQIPFALEDVIWDYQQMGGIDVDGITLDAEVGLFAMKREQVFRHLKPFTDAEVEVDIVQLSPLSIYNFVTHDLMGELPAPEEIDPENPPESVVVLAMGTETTDLVITNGSKLWQRSIPLGGNHFTKQLTKDLKLTFAKAEHLKRNARQAEDPKKIFQAMRPVFNDLVTEIQRSITYFQSIDRQAKVGRLVLLGNAVKLPGLRQYLEKNLGHQIVRVSSYSRLDGSTVTSAPAFKDNLLSFAGCYGLCLQGLGEAKLSTNLLPREFITTRRIREKKPWAVAAVGAMLLAFMINFVFCYNAWRKVHAGWQSTVYFVNDGNNEKPVDPASSGARSKAITWKDAGNLVANLQQTSSRHIDTDTKQMSDFELVRALGEEVVGNADRRLLWLELFNAINKALPVDPKNPEWEVRDPEEFPFEDRVEIQVEHLESEYYSELKDWFNSEVQRRYNLEVSASRGEKVDDEAEAESEDGEADGPAPEPPPTANSGGNDDGDDSETAGPSGPGWVIELKGYHYHNSYDSIQRGDAAANHLRNTLFKNLREVKIRLPTKPSDADDPVFMEFTLEELGIGYVIIAEQFPLDRSHKIPNPKVRKPGGADNDDSTTTFAAPMPTTDKKSDEPEIPLFFDAPKFSFRVQFCWQEQRLSERLEEKFKEEQQRKQAEAARAAEQAKQADADDGQPAIENEE